VSVLLDPAVAYFDKAEDPLHHVECVLDARANAGLRPIDLSLTIAQCSAARSATIREIACVRSRRSYHLGLPLVRGVAPNAGLVAMK
jgi:hypothetical protein